MKHINIARSVPHAARDLFALVADIESYPEFVPMCKDVTIRNREDLQNRNTIIIADMTIGYGNILQKYTSMVALDPNNLVIGISCINNNSVPLKNLEGSWRFIAVALESSEVQLYISYTMNNTILSILMCTVINSVCQKIVSAFQERADKIFAKNCAARLA